MKRFTLFFFSNCWVSGFANISICQRQSAFCIYSKIIQGSRGGVLEDVLGLENVLEDTFWSPWPRRSSPWPWPWPRSFKSSKIALSSARGQHYFLNSWISLENARNFAENLRARFGFPHLEHRRGQGEGNRGSASSPIEISRMTKMWQKSL